MEAYGRSSSYWFRQAIVIVLSFFAYLSLPLAPLLAPVYLFRFLVAALARTFRKDLGKMLSPRSTLFATEYGEMFSSRTRCTVYVWFVLDIVDVELEKIYKFCYDNVVMRKKEGSVNELQNPELQQTITSWLGYLFWKWDKDFDMENHMHLYKGPGKVDGITEEDMPQIVKELATRPFPAGRSPWDMWVWNDARLEGGENNNNDNKEHPKRLFLLRMHHSLGDGFSIMRMLIQDLEGMVMPVKNFETSSSETSYQGKLGPVDLCGILIRAPYELISSAIHSWDFNEWRLPESKIRGKTNVALTQRVDVERLKEIKRAYGSSFTAVIVAAFAGAIRNFMTTANMKVPNRIHCVVPLPMPGHPSKLRNHVTAVITPLPVGLPDARSRLEYSEQMLREAKKSSVPIATFIFLPLLGALPLFVVNILARNVIATALMSIVPGPQFMGKLMGHNAHRVMFGGGLLVGNIGLGLSSLSYNGYIRFGVGIDQGIYKDPQQAEHLVRLIEAELDTLFKESFI